MLVNFRKVSFEIAVNGEIVLVVAYRSERAWFRKNARWPYALFSCSCRNKRRSCRFIEPVENPLPVRSKTLAIHLHAFPRSENVELHKNQANPGRSDLCLIDPAWQAASYFDDTNRARKPIRICRRRSVSRLSFSDTGELFADCT